jgi:ribonuclease-3
VSRADALAERLGLPPGDRSLLEQALTHSSWVHEHPDPGRGQNERLEFLGDTVVGLAVSEALYARHPADDEGVLSARRAAIVSAPGLAVLAERLGIGEALLLGEGEANAGGRSRPSILASAFEAVIGAIFLDHGWATARDRVVDIAAPEIVAAPPPLSLKSPKSRLQEHTQVHLGSRPVYRLLEAAGPDHEKVFRVEVLVGDERLGTGTGGSRRAAETIAAGEALDILEARSQAAAEGADGEGSAS